MVAGGIGYGSSIIHDDALMTLVARCTHNLLPTRVRQGQQRKRLLHMLLPEGSTRATSIFRAPTGGCVRGLNRPSRVG